MDNLVILPRHEIFYQSGLKRIIAQHMDSCQEADATRAAIMCGTERQTIYDAHREGAGEVFSVWCSILQDLVQDA